MLPSQLHVDGEGLDDDHIDDEKHSMEYAQSL